MRCLVALLKQESIIAEPERSLSDHAESQFLGAGKHFGGRTLVDVGNAAVALFTYDRIACQIIRLDARPVAVVISNGSVSI